MTPQVYTQKGHENLQTGPEIFSRKILIRGKKRGVISEYLPWILIAIAVLALIMISIFLLKEKGVSLIDQIKNLFKGR